MRIIKDFALSILAHNQRIVYNMRIIKEYASWVSAYNQEIYKLDMCV